MRMQTILQRIVDYFRVLFLGAVVAWLTFPSSRTRAYDLLTPLAIIGMYIGTLDIEYSNLNSLKKYRKQTAQRYIMMMFIVPTILFFVINNFSTDTALWVLLLASAPAGISAIAFTRLMGGNTLLALCLAVVTTLLLPVSLPFLLHYAVWKTIQIDIWWMFTDLILFCIFPIIAAYSTQRFLPKVVEILRPHIDRVQIIMIAIMIVGPIAANATQFLSISIPKFITIVWGLFLLSTILHAAWWLCFTRSIKENKIAGSLAKWFMNLSITTVIAAKYFSPEVLLIVILYEFPWDLMLIPFKRFVKKQWLVANP